jgi:hypothetical protein
VPEREGDEREEDESASIEEGQGRDDSGGCKRDPRYTTEGKPPRLKALGKVKARARGGDVDGLICDEKSEAEATVTAPARRHGSGCDRDLRGRWVKGNGHLKNEEALSSA